MYSQLAILASYSGDELLAVYRYFRSLAVDTPFTTARDNLIIAFEKVCYFLTTWNIDKYVMFTILVIKESCMEFLAESSKLLPASWRFKSCP